MRGWILAAAAALAGCASMSQEAPSERAQARLAEALDGRVAGKAVDCVASTRLDGPDIIDSRTILYRESGRRIWRNDLPDACPFLRPDRIMIIELHGSDMCRNDLFSVIDRGGATIPIGKCRLGQFTPYERVRE